MLPRSGSRDGRTGTQRRDTPAPSSQPRVRGPTSRLISPRPWLPFLPEELDYGSWYTTQADQSRSAASLLLRRQAATSSPKLPTWYVQRANLEVWETGRAGDHQAIPSRKRVPRHAVSWSRDRSSVVSACPSCTRQRAGKSQL